MLKRRRRLTLISEMKSLTSPTHKGLTTEIAAWIAEHLRFGSSILEVSEFGSSEILAKHYTIESFPPKSPTLLQAIVNKQFDMILIHEPLGDANQLIELIEQAGAETIILINGASGQTERLLKLLEQNSEKTPRMLPSSEKGSFIAFWLESNDPLRTLPLYG